MYGADEKVIARVKDIATLCIKRGSPSFFGFLNEAEYAIASQTMAELSAKTNHKYAFYGGYDGAVRTMLGIFTDTYAHDYDEDVYQLFPIKTTTFTYEKDKSSHTLSHRDFLGSLLALGIKREAVGDVVVGDGFAVVFCVDTVFADVLSIEKVGRVGVKVSEGILHALPQQQFEEIEGVISSLRLDCIIALALKLSRAQAKAVIETGKVTLNYKETLDIAKIVQDKDTLSIRGFGKIIFDGSGALTRKGKLRVVLKKYK